MQAEDDAQMNAIAGGRTAQWMASEIEQWHADLKVLLEIEERSFKKKGNVSER